MSTPVLVLIAFIAIALVGWGVAEAKRKITYTHSAEEAHELEEMAEHDAQFGTEEMDVHQLIKNNSTKGYKAV